MLIDLEDLGRGIERNDGDFVEIYSVLKGLV